MKDASCKRTQLPCIRFLTHLGIKHLDQIARQCKVKLGNVEKDKSTVVEGILQYVSDHPGEPLRIVNNEKAKPFTFKVPKDKTIIIRVGDDLWKPVCRKTKSGTIVEWELKNPPVHRMEALIIVQARFGAWFHEVLMGPVIDDFKVPAGHTYIIDHSYVRINTLTMGTSSQLCIAGEEGRGAFPRGCWLEVDQYLGPWVMNNDTIDPYSWDAPEITSTVRRSWIENPNLVRPIGEWKYEYLCRHSDDSVPFYFTRGLSDISLNGKNNVNVPPPPRPLPRVGLKGNIGVCDPFCAYVPPTDGESHAGIVGEAGAAGVPGGDGLSARDLHVTMNRMAHIEQEGPVQSQRTVYKPGCVVRFCTNGGWGGNGGRGGSGQILQAGNGGDLSRWCSVGFSARKPGRGGDAGTGGDAGAGGVGGVGGDGGQIHLNLPIESNIADGTIKKEGELYIAIARRGNGGKGALSGLGGNAVPGQGGYWLEWLGDDPIWTEKGGEAGQDGTPGWPGLRVENKVKAPDGQKGLHGSIWVNGQLKMAGSADSDLPEHFCYPHQFGAELENTALHFPDTYVLPDELSPTNHVP